MLLRTSLSGLLVFATAASCGHIESYDYADVLRGPVVISEGTGGWSREPEGTTQEEQDALSHAMVRRQWELLPEWFHWSHTKMTLTGAVDGTTGKAELLFEVTARPEELEVAKLYIEHELVDTVSVERGGIVRGPGDLAIATLVGWTPAPERSFVPWGPARKPVSWTVSYGSASDPDASTCGIRVDPFATIREAEARDRGGVVSQPDPGHESTKRLELSGVTGRE